MILSDSPWQSIIKNTINFDELLSLGKSYIDSLLRKLKNKFWIDVLKAYSENLQVIRQDTEEFVLSSPIFHNHNIDIGNKPVWINNWYKNGVKHINDLISENREIQTRINHRLLPTKKYLHNMKLAQSPNCNFCQEEETISHMLWECQESNH